MLAGCGMGRRLGGAGNRGRILYLVEGRGAFFFFVFVAVRGRRLDYLYIGWGLMMGETRPSACSFYMHESTEAR